MSLPKSYDANPFRRLRKQAGMTLTGWASLLEVSLSYVQQIEGGVTLHPARMLEALESRGLCPPTMVEEYESWRKALSSSLTQALVDGSQC